MIRVDRIYIAPVKSLALAEVSQALLDKPGIAGDRAFYIIDSAGRLVTQRECGALVQIAPRYDVQAEVLTLTFPSGLVVEGLVELAEPLATEFFGHAVQGRATRGDSNSALSDFVGQPVRLVKADVPGTGFDGFPLSMCSTASLDALAQAAGRDSVDGRRFRQNIYISGAAAHEEDLWVGREVRAGKALLRVKMRDPRCVMTTHNPDTGTPDMNTLKIIASYRTDQPKEVNFGVYCTVVEPGQVTVGDEVAPIT
jgi:hypothetical protein